MKLNLIKIKTQKLFLLIPYLGLFLVALFQTINIAKIKDINKASRFLFISLFPMYFVVGCMYSLLIHPLIYNENNLTLTSLYVYPITYLLHVFMGIILLYLQRQEIKNNISEEDYNKL